MCFKTKFWAPYPMFRDIRNMYQDTRTSKVKSYNIKVISQDTMLNVTFITKVSRVFFYCKCKVSKCCFEGKF
ncbi:hypothetical protein ES332_A10G063300v1 [Gossypium tomentosum]|uniref:Uncharacterized protein n=1 Tax=Gossypium tomentosum TaxID=34277 RepID=A0A5D2NP03_GOSTO|nr:hypothetical protein ES332_A10G063300v1 [Gossypium tomentosum]